MRCIAIDDEPLALEIITQYCDRFGDIELKCFTDPIKGVEEVQRTIPDLLFLDIEMGVANGVAIARSLPSEVRVIFTTAYAQFAIDGFELNAVDFLHKPFAYVRFERALQKVVHLKSVDQDNASDEITVKVEYQSVKIKLNAVLYIESMDNYVKIHLAGQRPVLSQMSLKMIDALLPQDRFMRVHKSYIVARNRVVSYTRSAIVINNNSQQIPIGRTYQSNFHKWITE